MIERVVLGSVFFFFFNAFRKRIYLVKAADIISNLPLTALPPARILTSSYFSVITQSVRFLVSVSHFSLDLSCSVIGQRVP